MGRIETDAEKRNRLFKKLADKLNSQRQNPSDMQDILTKMMTYEDMLRLVFEYEQIMLVGSSKYRLAMMLSLLRKYSEEEIFKIVFF